MTILFNYENRDHNEARCIFKGHKNYVSPISARGRKARGLILVYRANTGCNMENGMHYHIYYILRNHTSKKCPMSKFNKDVMTRKLRQPFFLAC